jgi:hypothetical protein
VDESGARLLRDLEPESRLIRAQVTRGLDHRSASINATEYGKHASRDAAMQTVEASIINQMRPTLGDWIKFQVDPRRPKR